ncbi:MAG TPA: hypothetical protein VFT99_02320 [Roseiflexaceae bacterium]|nr:hypothetical protein [Roseiflexaceae bacterium]
MPTSPSQLFAPRAALAGRPAALAATGNLLLLADRRGTLLFWNWPDPPGPAIAAHGDGGPLAAVGGDLASSGGWDTHLIRWDATSFQPRFSAQPFNGRITALGSQGDDLLAAGADRISQPASPDDAMALQPGRIVRFDRAGNQSELALPVTGQVRALACGADWIAALDDAGDDVVVLNSATGECSVLAAGPATALAAHNSSLIVAGQASILLFPGARGNGHELARIGAGSARVLSLLALGDSLFGITSQGVMRWPGEQRFAREGSGQAVALAGYPGSLLVLWEDGTLEQRDAHSGDVLRAARTPQE